MPYGYRWQTYIRPAILLRDGYECVRCGQPDRPEGLRSALEVAHLDRSDTNDAPENLATFCHHCHKAYDYATWAPKFAAWLKRNKKNWLRRRKLKRVSRKDNGRPLLQVLMHGRQKEIRVDGNDFKRPILQLLKEAS
jgi:5-methylcytosine-specific restriction endonuclease McrA